MVFNDTVYSMAGDCFLSQFVIDAVIMGLMCTFGILGNILVFFAFGMFRNFNASTVLFRALAVSDSLLLLCVIPIAVPVAVANYVEFSSPLIQEERIYSMKYIFPVAIIAHGTTVWISVLLAINRYIAVCKPLMASTLCTVQNARKQVCCVLLLSIVLYSSHFFETNIRIEDGHRGLYYNSWARQRWYRILTWVKLALFFFIVPIGIILFLGLRVILGLRSAKTSQIRRPSQQDTSRDSVTRLVFVIILIFLICHTPRVVNRVLRILLPGDAKGCGTFNFYFQKVANVLVTMNSAVNFLIYFIFSKKFRKILCKKCTVQSSPIVSTVSRTSQSGYSLELKERIRTSERWEINISGLVSMDMFMR